MNTQTSLRRRLSQFPYPDISVTEQDIVRWAGSRRRFDRAPREVLCNLAPLLFHHIQFMGTYKQGRLP